MKQLTDDPWQAFSRSGLAGNLVPGRITRIVNFGLFVQLENGLEGLVYVSEIPGVSSQSLDKNFRPGDGIVVQVLHVDPEARKIALSLRNVPTSAGAPAASESPL